MAKRLTPEALADLIGMIYEAAVDPVLWPRFLDRFAIAMDARSALLWSHDFASHGAQFGNDATSFSGAVGFDPDFLDSYGTYYSHVNVWSRNEAALAEGVAVNSSMLYPDAGLSRTEYFNDWLRPQEIRYAIGGIVVKRATLGVKLSALRPESRGEYQEDELAFYRLLIPHLQRACALHRKLAASRVAAEGGLDTLDLLPTGIWLFDATGVVIHANRAARDVAQRSNGLSLGKDGLPTCTASAQTSQLRAMIARACRTGTGAGTSPGGMMLVHRLASAQPLQVLVAPLPHRNDPLGLRAAAVAFISDPSVDSLAPEDVLRHSFGLTRAEARLVSALVSGVSVADYAGMNERSRNTVRSQLKSAMAKLGVRRQADLVRVLLAVPRVGRP